MVQDVHGRQEFLINELLTMKTCKKSQFDLNESDRFLLIIAVTRNMTEPR